MSIEPDNTQPADGTGPAKPDSQETNGKADSEQAKEVNWEQKAKSYEGLLKQTQTENAQLKAEKSTWDVVSDRLNKIETAIADVSAAQLESLMTGDQDKAKVIARQQLQRRITESGISPTDPRLSGLKGTDDPVEALDAWNRYIAPALKVEQTVAKPSEPNQSSDPNQAVDLEEMRAKIREEERQRLAKESNLYQVSTSSASGGASAPLTGVDAAKQMIDSAKRAKR